MGLNIVLDLKKLLYSSVSIRLATALAFDHKILGLNPT